MTWLVQDWMTPIVQREAGKAAKAFAGQGWNADDLVNEFYVWMHEHPEKGWDRLSGDDEKAVNYFGATAYYMTRRFIKRDSLYNSAEISEDAIAAPQATAYAANPVGGESLEDYSPEVSTGRRGSLYERDELEALLPGIWSVDVSIYGVQRETQRDPEMPKGQGPNPSHGFTAAAKVADVKQAWKYSNLTLRQRQCVLLRHGADMTTSEAGNTLGIVKSKVSEHTSEGVTRMLAYLNG